MHHIKLLLFIAVTSALMAGCTDDSSTSPGDSNDTAKGTLKVLLTDSPGEYDEVNITFSEVSVHYSGESAEDEEIQDESEENSTTQKIAGEWIIVTDETQTFDLLTLSNGVTALLGEQEMDEGHYTQIRLAITEAEVVVDTVSYSLSIPSETLKFVSGFDIIPGIETELIVDFDAARSIHTTGKKADYKMKPTIRIINKAQCGSIAGTVINYENLPIAYAIAGDDTLTSSYVNENNGKFPLSFLPEGSYPVSAADTLKQSYSIEGVAVTLATKTDIGDITLE